MYPLRTLLGRDRFIWFYSEAAGCYLTNCKNCRRTADFDTEEDAIKDQYNHTSC